MGRPRVTSWRAAVAAAVAAASLVLAGCGSGGGSAAATDGELTVAVPSAVSSLNPIKIGTGIPDQFFVQPAYDSLIVRSSDGTLVPGLATEWAYTDATNRTFQLTLREGVAFSDGTPLDAAAVKQWMEYFKGGNGLFSSRFANVTSIDVDGPQRLTMHLAASDAAWPESLTQDRYGYVISPKGIANPDALGTASFGAGPYVLDPAATVSGSVYSYTRNPSYWNPEQQHWDRLTIKVVPDAAARLSAVQSGQADVAVGDATTASTAQTGRSAIDVVTAPYLWNSLILLDRGGALQPALGDARVRQALNFAVDRTAVAKAVFRDFGDPNVSMLTPEMTGFAQATEDRYSYDPAKAKALLAEAGYPNGFTLDVIVSNRNGLESTFAQSLTSYYDAIGVKLTLHQMERGAAVQALRNKQYPAMVFFGQVEAPNLLTQEQLQASSGVLNPWETTDAPLQDLYARFQATPAGPEQTALQEQMQARIVDQGLYVPISTLQAVYFVREGVTGVEVSGGEPIMNLYTLRPAADTTD
ncbi:ABC transporter substrate-binding protein [Pseudonocardia sp. RS11V-5]|uniref:ABC transporter substrate-binding protein n=1 Tax=Pseudonocardia terrae TaxID=2905831 RepID=UPI001E4396F9|nr:ABC transporter substrate-binding protein [Pseudonocardia terrae]MCE3555909.1 ABC transporter substrate-binding protein [Pseudonocardia terrae]